MHHVRPWRCTRMPETKPTMPSMRVSGEGRVPDGDRALVGFADRSPQAVSAHPGDGPSRFRPPGGDAALTAPG